MQGSEVIILYYRPSKNQLLNTHPTLHCHGLKARVAYAVMRQRTSLVRCAIIWAVEEGIIFTDNIFPALDTSRIIINSTSLPAAVNKVCCVAYLNTITPVTGDTMARTNGLRMGAGIRERGAG